MNELQSSNKLAKPLTSARSEAAMLENLTRLAASGAHDSELGAAINSHPPEAQATAAAVPAPVETPAPAVPQSLADARIFYTGKFKSGKDFLAVATGATVISIAEPLYYLQRILFGHSNKDLLGAREFLQQAGQIGRGFVDKKYPLTLTRAAFVAGIQAMYASKLFDESLHVDWHTFGTNPDIWIDSAIARSNLADGRIAITNVRFPNEHKRLTQTGWRGYHVMCSTETWLKRLDKAGIDPNGPAAKDTSEQLAASLDAQVNRKLSQQPRGPKLRVIWSDESVRCPSPRIYTVAEFSSLFTA